jgi:hypothetical protein
MQVTDLGPGMEQNLRLTIGWLRTQSHYFQR